ncbi:ubiquitin-related domain-containing protein [Cladochytrium replicatum]|nr:ubiquitin-related domain-containing protein [Cladochytrium replicatum]
MTADASQPADKKVEHINLKVVGSDNTEIAFKIKRSTPLSKLMDAYIQKTGLDRNSIRFLFEGDRLQPHNTPDELDMEDGDQISVAVQQLGGQC